MDRSNSPPRLVGYARVSTDDQATAVQLPELQAAGCTAIFEEQASGGDRDRPVLARALASLRPGDTLVVVRLDRLARSLRHLLEVLESLSARRIYFRSLGDPVDTSSASGMFVVQILGAVAEFERRLIGERTKSGLRRASAQGRRGGNPRLRGQDSMALREVAAANDERYLAKVLAAADTWLPVVRRLRPEFSWSRVVRVLNEPLGPADRWTVARLRRAVARLVQDGLAEAVLLGRAKRHKAMDLALVGQVAEYRKYAPHLTLADIAGRLEATPHRPPGGGAAWQVSTVRALLLEAARVGLLPVALARSQRKG